MPAQMLAFDRGLPAGSPLTGSRLAKTDGPGFIGDHFQIGGSGEVWIVDAIRVWGAATQQGADSRALPDVFTKAALFGGIEAAAPDPNAPPQPKCDCHDLMTIKSADLRQAAKRLPGSDVQLSNVSSGIWQLDFQHLHWSVPGGVLLQFGVMVADQGGSRGWYGYASETGPGHQLKSFDEKGALKGSYARNGVPMDDKIGLNVQVWAHKMAPVAIRSAGTVMEVVLRSDASFEAANIDAASLRFGPASAAPIDSHPETVEGRAAVVVRFRRADTGIHGPVSACLTGRQLDGVPFEGCDLTSD
jgi:hypothetical protein